MKNKQIEAFFRIIQPGNSEDVQSKLARHPRLANCHHPRTGYMPLHAAIQVRDRDIITVLLAFNANPDGIANGSGTVVREMASWHGLGSYLTPRAHASV